MWGSLDSRGRHRAACSRSGRLLFRSALWRECAVKPGPRCDTTRNSATWTLRCSRQVCLTGGGRHPSVRRCVGRDSKERPGWTVPFARGHGRTRNGSIRNSSVLTGVASWWLLLKLEGVGAPLERSDAPRGDEANAFVATHDSIALHLSRQACSTLHS